MVAFASPDERSECRRRLTRRRDRARILCLTRWILTIVGPPQLPLPIAAWTAAAVVRGGLPLAEVEQAVWYLSRARQAGPNICPCCCLIDFVGRLARDRSVVLPVGIKCPMR